METTQAVHYKACQGTHSRVGLEESLQVRQVHLAQIVDYEADTGMDMAVVEMAGVADETAELEAESLADQIRSVRQAASPENLDCA